MVILHRLSPSAAVVQRCSQRSTSSSLKAQCSLSLNACRMKQLLLRLLRRWTFMSSEMPFPHSRKIRFCSSNQMKLRWGRKHRPSNTANWLKILPLHLYSSSLLHNQEPLALRSTLLRRSPYLLKSPSRRPLLIPYQSPQI